LVGVPEPASACCRRDDGSVRYNAKDDQHCDGDTEPETQPPSETSVLQVVHMICDEIA
jgi:hypothetical protein